MYSINPFNQAHVQNWTFNLPLQTSSSHHLPCLSSWQPNPPSPAETCVSSLPPFLLSASHGIHQQILLALPSRHIQSLSTSCLRLLLSLSKPPSSLTYNCYNYTLTICSASVLSPPQSLHHSSMCEPFKSCIIFLIWKNFKLTEKLQELKEY